MHLESKTGSNSSVRKLRRRVVSGRCSGAAKAASCEARELRALRAREVAWRHAGSTRNEVRSKVEAVAAEVQLAEKRGDAPLLPLNQRQRGGEPNEGLAGQVVRGEPRDVVDGGRLP